jgi:CheY-like chemotaxis protein
MSKEKLLVLDDEPLILSSLESLFEDDYEVLTTTDAAEGLGTTASMGSRKSLAAEATKATDSARRGSTRTN